MLAWLGYFVPVTYLFLRRPSRRRAAPVTAPLPAGARADVPTTTPERPAVPTSG